MKEAHAAREKNMFWLEIPVSAQQDRYTDKRFVRG
jgi:hypothetical protein